MHDPAIGRFMQIDPLAEDYVYNGTYNFAENRVIDGFELEGLEWVDVDEDGEKYTVYDPNFENEDGTMGKYHDKATDEQKKYGDALKGSGEMGAKMFGNLVKADHEVVVNFLDLDVGSLLGIADVTLDESGEKIIKTTIDIFMKGVEDAAKNPDDWFYSKDTKVITENNLTLTDVVASVLGHEIGHDTVTNEKTRISGGDHERGPRAIQSKILEELAQKKKSKTP